MKEYLGRSLNLLYKLLLLIALYTFCRAFFFVVNYQSFSSDTFWNLTKVFLFGIRFDYSAIVQYNLLFVVLYLLPFNFVNHKYYKATVNVLFFVVNFALLLSNLGDSEYFKYTGKRTTADIFRYILISNDTAVLLPQFLRDFWYIVLTWLACVVGGVWAMKHEPAQSTHIRIRGTGGKRVLAFAGIGLLFILIPGILFLAARGLGLKPLRIISTARYTTPKNVPLLINTPFSILHTIQDETVKPIVYFDNREMEQIYSPLHNSATASTQRQCNVMIIILESFSKEFVGSLNGTKGYTPHLDSIIRQGLVFENGFANGKRSIEALPALFAGLPVFTNDSYISSRYSGNNLKAMPAILAEHGYATSFFHGGRNGTMGFDDFSRLAGITKYYGLNEYNGPKAFDGNWGIADEEFLQFYASKLKQMKQPFFSSVFTLSSHHPYTVPAKHADKFIDAPNPFIRSIEYADYSLGRFFATISKQDWYKNTLFILVADHAGKEYAPVYSTQLGMFRIPIVFFQPGNAALHGISKRIAQQSDVMPTVLNYLGIEVPYLAFGKNLFDPKSPDYAANFLGGTYQYVSGNYALQFDGNSSIGLYNFTTDKLLKNNLKDDSVRIAADMERKLKAMVQQYNYRLINNKMTN